MYENLFGAIIRPGNGTITDALSSSARIFSFYETGNQEMITNSSRISKYGVGVDCGNIEDAWEESLNYFNNHREYKCHSENIAKLLFGAEKEATDIILF